MNTGSDFFNSDTILRHGIVTKTDFKNKFQLRHLLLHLFTLHFSITLAHYLFTSSHAAEHNS